MEFTWTISLCFSAGARSDCLRAGTDGLYAIAGMGEAARLAKAEKVDESMRLQALRDGLIKESHEGEACGT